MNIELININKYENDDYIYCGRPSKWGNPYSSKKSNIKDTIIVKNPTESIMLFEKYIDDNIHLIDELIDELKKRKINKLGCFCYPKKCHTEILVQKINNRKFKSIF